MTYQKASIKRNLPIICQLLIVTVLGHYLLADYFRPGCGGSRVPLPNGYEFSVPESSVQLLYREVQDRAPKGDWFRFINRIYVNDRYIVGEAIPKDNAADNNNFVYFIIDTQTDHSSGEISKTSWTAELAKLGISHQVKLEQRSKKWRYAMCSRYGRTKVQQANL